MVLDLNFLVLLGSNFRETKDDDGAEVTGSKEFDEELFSAPFRSLSACLVRTRA